MVPAYAALKKKKKFINDLLLFTWLFCEMTSSERQDISLLTNPITY